MTPVTQFMTHAYSFIYRMKRESASCVTTSCVRSWQMRVARSQVRTVHVASKAYGDGALRAEEREAPPAPREAVH